MRRQTLADYRRLRLSVGELVRPLLLDPPDIERLYPFQRAGVRWLTGQAGGVLADDMGLGKTVQVIAAMRLLFNRGELRHAVVVCPKGLIATWEREFGQWAPELCLAVVTPPARIREAAWRALARRQHVLVTNYEQFRDPPEALWQEPPDLIVADEAHRLRNWGAQVTAGSHRLAAKRFWALSGTPVERDTEDLATLLSIVAPRHFAPSDAGLHPASLRSQARKFVLRRTKRDVLKDLPDVLDTVESIELSDEQQRAYRAAVKLFRSSGDHSQELALLTALQALCDIEPESGASSKIERILWRLEAIRGQGEKAVVFSYRLEPLRQLHRRMSERWGQESASLLLGEMDNDERERAVRSFREDGQTLALLASSRVGSEGLTLTEANHVFLLNQWWNPSSNDQARDRVVRIGQHRSVRVYRLCCRGTVEEALERILASKRELFDDVVGRMERKDDGAWAGLLSEVGIDRLISGSA